MENINHPEVISVNNRVASFYHTSYRAAAYVDGNIDVDIHFCFVAHTIERWGFYCKKCS